MNDKKTSRHWILDLVEAIGNTIALCSHLQENINAINDSHYKGSEEATVYQDVLLTAIDLRRNMMLRLQQEFEDQVNTKYRCSLKHAISTRGYMTEVLYASPYDKSIQNMQQEATEIMYTILSEFIGEELTTCGRCLSDALLSTNDNK